MTSDCIFCAIVAAEAPAAIVGENELALAIMDINPATDGHTLVISKVHAVDIWDLPPQDGREMWSLAAEAATAIRDGLQPDGLTVFQANRAAGWQEVFHFHLHLVPRYEGDDLVKPWTPSSAGRDRSTAAAERIRSASPGS